MGSIVQSDRYLKLTHDRKTSPAGIFQESRNRWIATIPNSFGLPSGDTCPGKTPFCVSCYAVNSEKSQGVRGLVEHNLRLLQVAGTVDGMSHLLAEMVGRYLRYAERRNVAPADRVFRIHWDGDFFSVDYAKAWARVIRGYPSIQFWAYTRSFTGAVDVVPTLAGIPNLMLYLSADQWNLDAAKESRDRHGVTLAYCTVDYTTGRDMAADADRPPIVCPENNGRIPLMDLGRGACVECRICPDGRRDVIFSTSHRDNVFAPSPAHVREAQRAGVCANPDCDNRLVQPKGRGRPKKWCDDEGCRREVRRLMRRAG